jgi:Ca-activated chloride channel family protein
LLDEIRLRGESAELKEEVTELARQFSIVTPYTAYLIVEDEKSRAVPVTAQTLPQLREDRAAWGMARSTFDSLSHDKAGEGGVANALNGLAFRRAETPAQALADGYIAARRNLSTAAAAMPPGESVVAAGGRLENYTRQQRFVNHRGFFQNGSGWVDAEVQKQQAARRVRLQFNTPEYFAFVASNTAARPWLALGRNVQFVQNHTVYEIYE